jgi:hypothetical protein
MRCQVDSSLGGTSEQGFERWVRTMSVLAQISSMKTQSMVHE